MNLERSGLDKRVHQWEREIYGTLEFLGLDRLWVFGHCRVWHGNRNTYQEAPSHA